MTSIKSGVYRLVNAKAHTNLCVDVDGRSVIGDPDDGDRSLWRVEQSGDQWTLENAGVGRFLGLDGQAVTDATPVIVGDEAGSWDIWPEEADSSVYRLAVPYQPRPLQVDLADHGNSAPRTPAHVWSKVQGKSQCWSFEAL